MSGQVKAKRKKLPHPILSCVMLLTWLSLTEFDTANLVFGTFLALSLPFLVQRFWPTRVKVYKPFKLIGYLLLVVVDICIANFVVAKQILGPTRKLKAQFFYVPLELKHDFTISVLAGTITLTPGTVSAHLAKDKTHLLVHALNVEDTEQMIHEIKNRYEKPLKEIFECSN